jgi:hypothetical protein
MLQVDDYRSAGRWPDQPHREILSDFRRVASIKI